MRLPLLHLVVAALGLAVALVVAGPAAAQILSPGKLSRPHAELEGIRQCTACHQLGTPGVSAALCLECHAPLAERVRAEKGYHAQVESDCATCHQEHLGVEFALVRMDPARFDHSTTGFLLEGNHRDVACRDCHTPALVADPAVRRYAAEHGALERTYLGLPVTCASCHRDDDPHGRQFTGRACTDCHSVAGWDRVPGFDHAATRYPLTGRHAAVECAQCHTPARGAAATTVYRPVEFGSCTACHQDPHEGSMRESCESCHRTTGWERVDRSAIEARFDHGTTRFDLVGGHAELSCASCHDARTASRLAGIRIQFVPGTAARAYPRPRTGSCLSCHQDSHDGVFTATAGGADCAGCHGEHDWIPAAYDLARHDREAAFALEGAHRTVACADCHRSDAGALVFRPPSATCTDCHADDDPHAGQFPGQACSSCHAQEAFRIPAFDHARTRFALDGVHREVACAGCHRTETPPDGVPFVRYAPLGTACRDCHEDVR
jgi:hypothetical protein